MQRAPVGPLQREPDMLMPRHMLNDSGSAEQEVGFEVGGGRVGRVDGLLEGMAVGCGKESKKHILNENHEADKNR